jgi:replicative DNA helicase
MNLEKSIISQMITNPDIPFKTKLKPEHFQSNFCRTVFIAIRSLLQRGIDVDLPTLASESDLRASDLAEITSIESGNWKYQEEKIIDAYQVMQIKLTCERIIKSKLPAKELVSELMQSIDSYDESDNDRILTQKEIIHSALDDIEEANRNQGKIIGVSSGIRALDKRFNGFRKRRLYIIGGRPSQGKTALLVNLVYNSNKKVGVISAESAGKDLGKREFSLGTRINGEKLDSGNLSHDEFNKLLNMVDKIAGKEIYYYEKANSNIENVILKAREMKQRWGIEALYVDYIQQIQSSNSTKRHEQVGYISTKLKEIARNLDIPVIAAAQLRRDATGRVPELADFGESGQIERDADVAMLLHHGKMNEEEGSFIIIAKNRDGATGATRVHFNKDIFEFTGVE